MSQHQSYSNCAVSRGCVDSIRSLVRAHVRICTCTAFTCTTVVHHLASGHLYCLRRIGSRHCRRALFVLTRCAGPAGPAIAKQLQRWDPAAHSQCMRTPCADQVCVHNCTEQHSVHCPDLLPCMQDGSSTLGTMRRMALSASSMQKASTWLTHLHSPSSCTSKHTVATEFAGALHVLHRCCSNATCWCVG